MNQKIRDFTDKTSKNLHPMEAWKTVKNPKGGFGWEEKERLLEPKCLVDGDVQMVQNAHDLTKKVLWSRILLTDFKEKQKSEVPNCVK